ncbi:MAG: LytTR family transcriptional regulator [Clostridia bacterium]|nr:LytTR family transcriptional regulator [Clostridia bacterium]
MKCKLIIDRDRPEEVEIRAHRESRLTRAIERLCEEDGVRLIGYREREIVPLHPPDVCCFIVEDNKIFALTATEKLQLKCRLYTLEEELPDSFVKLNQSCSANLAKIERFDSSFAGTLTVLFQGGYTDYVSRRNLKTVKERICKFYE